MVVALQFMARDCLGGWWSLDCIALHETTGILSERDGETSSWVFRTTHNVDAFQGHRVLGLLSQAGKFHWAGLG